MEAAHRYARRTLAGIDWSEKDIVLFVSGTADPGTVPKIDKHFLDGAQTVWADGGVSYNLLRYESNWNLRESVATGIETLRLVLAGLAAHRGHRRVFLVGLSQGAWVLGEALKDPKLDAGWDRAVLMGHPALAASHYDDGHDPRILEINDPFDRIAWPLNRGTEATGMAAYVRLKNSPGVQDLPLMVKALLANPAPGMLSLLAIVRELLPSPLNHLLPEPHDYRKYAYRAAHFLDSKVDIAPGGNADESAAAARRILMRRHPGPPV